MRRLVVSLVALLTVAAAGYTGYWLSMAERLRAGLDPWAAALRSEGYALRWTTVGLDGFPASFRLTFANAAFSGARPVPFEVAGGVLIAQAWPWDLRHWRVHAPAGARLEALGEGDAIAAAALDGTVGIMAGGGKAVDLWVQHVVGSGVAAGLSIADAELKLTLADDPPAGQAVGAFDAALSLTGMALPYQVPPLGHTVEALSLVATLKGALPQGNPREALAAWRDAGGAIELSDASLRWGALAADAHGTLALDAALQPTGVLTATISDHDAIIDAAVANGSLKPGDASLAKIVLGMMAKPGPDGKKRLTLPVSVKNDRVFLGPAQIAALPRITWE